MKRRYISKNLLLLTFTGFFFNANCQSVTELMDESKSFAQIRKTMTSKFEGFSYKKGNLNYSREYKQFKRWEYFWKHHLTADGNFPSGKTIYDAWKESELQRNQKTNASNWQYVGPKDLPVTNDIDHYPGMGRVNAIAIHPTNKSVLIIGAASSGIWKSTDKGQTWQSKTDKLPNIGISDISFDPNNSNILYAATGDADGNRGPFSTGIFKSTNAGDTWSIVGLSNNLSTKFQTRRILLPKSPTNSILITTNKGIQRSTDGGATWTIVHSTSTVFDIEQKPGSQTIFYCATRNGKILKSTNGGTTWSDISPQNITLNGRVEIGVTPNDPNLIFAVDAQGKLVKSNNSGTSWTSLSNLPNYDSQGGFNMTVAISPKNKNRIIIAGIHGWRSINGGQTWEKYLDGYWNSGDPYFYVHSDHHVMKFESETSDVLYCGNDGGIFYGDISTNTAFKDITRGLSITQYYGLGALRTDASKIVAGAQDNDGVYIDGNSQKGLLPSSDGFDGMIDYGDPKVAYAARTSGRVSKTTDNWQNSSQLIIPGYYSAWEVPMAMHPTDPSTIYFGGNILAQSKDKGSTWNTLYTASNQNDVIKEMAIAPSDAKTIVIYDGVELKRTTDNGTNWTTLTFSHGTVSGIAIHATKPNHIYVGVSGYSSGSKVFKSTNGGTSWTNISYNLPNIPVHTIAYVTGTKDDLYIGTDLGVYYNTNNQSNWQLFNTNLPYTQVYELEVNYKSNSILAATYGRGIWKSPLNLKSTSIYSTDEQPDLFNVFPTINDGRFSIQLKEQTITEMELIIYNSIGGVVQYQKLNEQEQRIDISHVSAGYYFVTLKQGTQISTQKIIIND